MRAASRPGSPAPSAIRLRSPCTVGSLRLASVTRRGGQLPRRITITSTSARPSMRTAPLLQGSSIGVLIIIAARAGLRLGRRSAATALDCDGRPQAAAGRVPSSLVEGSTMLARARHRVGSLSVSRGHAPQDKGAPGGSAERVGEALHCVAWRTDSGGLPGGTTTPGAPPPAVSPHSSHPTTTPALVPAPTLPNRTGRSRCQSVWDVGSLIGLTTRTGMATRMKRAGGQETTATRKGPGTLRCSPVERTVTCESLALLPSRFVDSHGPSPRMPPW